MAKKKRPSSAAPTSAEAAPAAAPVDAAPAAAQRPVLPAEAAGPGVAVLLALAVFLAPALGVPHEEMLQDTLKSIVVSFAALFAAWLLFWQQRGQARPLRWHAVLWLPLLLAAYALGSMAWSHPYLGGVEAIRWFVFSLLAWLALNSFSRNRLPWLAWGIHGGAVVASLWAALQFWVDFGFFPQGPNPASTFVNRNFFAEFVVCTVPFSALLLARARQSAAIALLAASMGLVLVAILMTGTRAALIALWLQLLLVLPLIAWRCRRLLAWSRWSVRSRILAAGVLLGTVALLGAIPSGNAKLLEEGRGSTAFERGFNRTGSIRAGDESLGVRMLMWRATLRMIADRPLTGVGAGAWENDIPLYQAARTQLETDYYVHNEVLQLVAEYGLAGVVFLLALLAYLLQAGWRTWHQASRTDIGDEAAWRAALLCSLLALLLVSNVGFPWRLAATGALFAVVLGALAGSDARLEAPGRWGPVALPWKRGWALPALGATSAALLLAATITQRAAESERLIVGATRIALAISASADPNHPRWNARKAEMLRMIRAGTDINPHYRKITPMVADELARWGDWKNATWIWESVLSSRPRVVAILANAARGHTALGDPARAATYLERARAIRPDAPAVRSLEVVLMARAGQDGPALQAARRALDDQAYDIDLLNAAFDVAARTGDAELALRAMALRQEQWPAHRLDGHLRLGRFQAQRGDAAAAAASFRAALSLAAPAQREGVLAQVPPALRARVQAP